MKLSRHGKTTKIQLKRQGKTLRVTSPKRYMHDRKDTEYTKWSRTGTLELQQDTMSHTRKHRWQSTEIQTTRNPVPSLEGEQYSAAEERQIYPWAFFFFNHRNETYIYILLCKYSPSTCNGQNWRQLTWPSVDHLLHKHLAVREVSSWYRNGLSKYQTQKRQVRETEWGSGTCWHPWRVYKGPRSERAGSRTDQVAVSLWGLALAYILLMWLSQR